MTTGKPVPLTRGGGSKMLSDELVERLWGASPGETLEWNGRVYTIKRVEGSRIVAQERNAGGLVNQITLDLGGPDPEPPPNRGGSPGF